MQTYKVVYKSSSNEFLGEELVEARSETEVKLVIQEKISEDFIEYKKKSGEVVTLITSHIAKIVIRESKKTADFYK